jgi:hypothetical protein
VYWSNIHLDRDTVTGVLLGEGGKYPAFVSISDIIAYQLLFIACVMGRFAATFIGCSVAAAPPLLAEVMADSSSEQGAGQCSGIPPSAPSPAYRVGNDASDNAPNHGTSITLAAWMIMVNLFIPAVSFGLRYLYCTIDRLHIDNLSGIPVTIPVTCSGGHR